MLGIGMVNRIFRQISLHSFLFPVKPVEKEVTTFYQISPGRDYEVKLNYSANPSPNAQQWKYGDSFESTENVMSIPGDYDGYIADYEASNLYIVQHCIQPCLFCPILFICNIFAFYLLY